jgi:type II secretory pathway pseudopilin PulG
MKHHRSKNRDQGFALVGTLAVLVVVTILVVAYSSTMRTERAASENYAEYDRAQALAQGMLNRILADHATPQISNQVLRAYDAHAYYDSEKAQPRPSSPYLTTDPEDALKIFTMEPTPGIKTANGLVRISKNSNPGGGQGRDQEIRAYDPEYWSYIRVDDDTESLIGMSGLFPSDVPEFIDYYDVDPSTGKYSKYPSGQIAFAIWDDSGKIDVNMLGGPDENINGLAPYHLDLEDQTAIGGGKLINDPGALADYLNGDENRERTNFSLRRISSDNDDNTGNDRWFFSIEELVKQNIISPDKVPMFTTWSRDFDVRPEWDGKRTVTDDPKDIDAQTFLRSYVNNPKLYALFTHPQASAKLVLPTLNEKALEQRAQQVIGAQFNADKENWMQAMRLLAALRLALPPFDKPIPSSITFPSNYSYWPASKTDPGEVLKMNEWFDEDVFGIALNIMQATSPPYDENLFAYNRQSWQGQPYNDPTNRLGVRITPFVTEVVFKVEYGGSPGTVNVTETIELWNPYPVDLSVYRYRVGEWGGSAWPPTSSAPAPRVLYHIKDAGGIGTPGRETRENQPGPGRGQYTTVSLETRKAMKLSEDPQGGGGLRLRARPYIQPAYYNGRTGYYGEYQNNNNGIGGADQSTSYVTSIALFGTFVGSGTSEPEKYQLVAWIPPDRIPQTAGADPVYYSFQIDDPRMGPFNRQGSYKAEGGDKPANFQYSWQGYLGEHTLGAQNKNFGSTWPEGAGKFTLAKALATFALPGRPFLNIGELGTVFANRPWTTLSFAQTTAPTGRATGALNFEPVAGPKIENSPTALLNYLTTIGTITQATNLNFIQAGNKPPAGQRPLVAESEKWRTQDKRWLFDGVTGVFPKQTAGGNLRPIRGRVNLNSASEEVIAALLKPAYRMPNSLGLPGWPGLSVEQVGTDLEVTIQDEKLIEGLAEWMTNPANNVRPLRSLADLSRLDQGNGAPLKTLRERLPDSVVDAMVGRLAQFGTVRQQIYTVDIVARALNPKREKERVENPDLPREATAEVKMRARVYFDTFSRKSFIESVEYR